MPLYIRKKTQIFGQNIIEIMQYEQPLNGFNGPFGYLRGKFNIPKVLRKTKDEHHKTKKVLRSTILDKTGLHV